MDTNVVLKGEVTKRRDLWFSNLILINTYKLLKCQSTR